MLDRKVLDDLIESFNLPPKGKDLIDRIIDSPPARAVRTGPKNRSGYYASQKMGFTVQYESGHWELALVRTWENDNNVIGFWDQPILLKIPYVRKDGKNHAILYTPDFFVIWRKIAGFVECKTEEKMASLAKEYPNRYHKGEDVLWHNPWAEKYCEQFGLGYWIMTETEIDRTYLRNLDFLEDYIHADPQAIDKEARIRLLAHVASRPGIRLSDLIALTLQADLSTDIIYLMITHEILYADLSAAALAESDRVYVFASKEAAQEYNPGATPPLTDIDFIDVVIGSTVVCDGKPAEIVNIGEKEIWLCGETRKVVRLTHEEFEELFRKGLIEGLKSPKEETIIDEVNRTISEASPTELQEANRRVEFVHRYLAGERFSREIIAERTMYHYLADYRASEARYGSGYLGLIPNFHGRGNREQRFDDVVREALDDAIKNNFETEKQKSFTSVHNTLANQLASKGLEAPSLPTFIKMTRLRSKSNQVRKRKGPKAAKQVQPFSHWLEKDTPPQGDRPFQICHVDHTKLDLRLRCSQTGRILGRPWATFLTCGFSRRLLAIYLSFDPPSYRSCMMVLRECMRRFGRLMQYLVHDGGKEFKSVYFRALLGFFGIHTISREGKPRDGSTCERLFDTNRRQLLNNMLGNTQIMKNVREVSPEFDPSVHAVWTLEAAYRRLCEWGYEIYDAMDHWTLKQSPREAFNSAILTTGSRESRLRRYDETFRLLTLPTTRKGTSMIIPNYGVKINNIYYWNDVFYEPELQGVNAPVRYEPFDKGQGYAYVKGKWTPCKSEYYWFFQGRTEREMSIASSELRRQNLLLHRNRTINAAQLAEFVQSLEEEEKSLKAYFIRLQRIRDLEQRAVHSAINETQPTPAPHSRMLLPGDKPHASEYAGSATSSVFAREDDDLEEIELVGGID